MSARLNTNLIKRNNENYEKNVKRNIDEILWILSKQLFLP